MRTYRFILILMLSLGSLTSATAQALDISSGGTPTISGAVGGSVTGNTSLISDLSFTIDFGELSPVNPSGVVRVTLPIAIRSNQPYQVSMTVTGESNAVVQGLQKSDVGFGVGNIRPIGPQARTCTQSSHTFNPLFYNDPSVVAFISSSGRAAYPSSLANAVSSTVILSGPRLTSNNNPNRNGNDGWVFDAIFVVTPQFFASGTTSTTVNFTISAGPNVPC